MSGFRFRTFSPEADAADLAPPPPAITEAELLAAREEAHREGFLAGEAAATDAHLADQARLTSELVEALNDARLTNEAARRHVLASFAPMVGALVAALSARLADAALQAEILRRVERALSAAPEPKPRLRVAPELVERLGGLLAERGLDVEIEAGATLLPRESELRWDDGLDHIDIDACAAEIAECVARHLGLEPTGAAPNDQEGAST